MADAASRGCRGPCAWLASAALPALACPTVPHGKVQESPDLPEDGGAGLGHLPQLLPRPHLVVCPLPRTSPPGAVGRGRSPRSSGAGGELLTSSQGPSDPKQAEHFRPALSLKTGHSCGRKSLTSHPDPPPARCPALCVVASTDLRASLGACALGSPRPLPNRGPRGGLSQPLDGSLGLC